MTAKEFSQRLSRRAKRVGLVLPSNLAEKLRLYFELLFRWNEKINLTSLDLGSPDEAIDRLLIEPLLASRYIEREGPRLIDVGSGGGSPAIPLALAKPGVALVMVESKARKCAFLREALRHLGLEGLVESARFEELLARTDFHEAFDYLSLRAVRTDLRTLNTLQAFVKPDGRLLLFKAAGRSMQTAEVVPPLRWLESIPLRQGSELQLLEKRRIP
ncbi:MAG: 16S rRNA (guanine(527)-N(7))-methyltransferase RsmG [Acidobacteriota bacterium]